MKIFVLFLTFFSLFVINAYAEKFCVDSDGEEVSIGTRYLVTCETNPKTPESIVVQYCYKDDEGQAKWSPKHTEISPDGC